MNLERWRYYMPLDIYVSNLGNIRGADGEPQKVCVANGYTHYKGRRVHRIVLEAWNPVPGFADLTVDHLNHNTRDNRLSNLEWVSESENTQRDLDDRDGNLPSDNGVLYVKLNGVKIPADTAKKIVAGDKSVHGASNMNKVFDKAKHHRSGAFTYGNFTIQYCD